MDWAILVVVVANLVWAVWGRSEILKGTQYISNTVSRIEARQKIFVESVTKLVEALEKEDDTHS